MSPKFRLEDVDAPSLESESNPVVESVARINYPSNACSQYGCRPDNCHAGGVCRSKRNREDIYRY
jgi:hypothetical protein